MIVELRKWMRLKDLSLLQKEAIQSKLIIPNPEYEKNEKLGFSNRGVPVNQKLFKTDGDDLLVPRGLIRSENLAGNADEIKDRMEYGSNIEYGMNFELGPNQDREENQKEFVDDLEDSLKSNYEGAVGQAPPGFGKTVCAIDLIRRIGKTAAVLVHKSFLINQWKERILEATDLNEDDIGIVWVGQDKFQYKDKKIVLVMAQSLVMSSRQYPEDFFNYFGTLVVDEVHRFAANVFRKAVIKFPTRYRVGLSATPKRKDKLEVVFFGHIGTVKAEGTKSKLGAKVKMINTKVKPSLFERNKITTRSGDIHWSLMETWLTEHQKRNRLIVKLIIDALKQDRKILLLSSRRKHLKVLAHESKKYLKKLGLNKTTGFYVGGMSQMQLKAAESRDVLFATYGMAKEGLDIPKLDTLFLATPKSSVHQAVGRILRQADKKVPLVVDFVDDIGMCHGVAKKRRNKYAKLGFELI